MRVTVLHNPTAGEDDVRAADLLAALRDAGHQVCYHDTSETDAFGRVQDPGDVLLAAGGDGTVRKVALRLGGLGAPIAVLPLGTANNIAGVLGAPAALDAMVASLESGRRVAFDVGVVTRAGRTHPFLEAVGVGLFAEAMTVVQQNTPDDDLARAVGADAEITRDLRLLRTLLPLQRAVACRVEIDGAVTECSALLVEIMNNRTVGPKLLLAPDAAVDDGLLDVVIATEAHRAALCSYLDARIDGRSDVPAGLQVRRGRHVRLRWATPVGHIDDEAIPHAGRDLASVPIELEAHTDAGALRFIVP